MRLPHWGPIGWLLDSPEEVWFFFRISAYAFFIGTVYWFLTYESAGTMLLYGFGIGAAVGVVVLGLGARHAVKASIPNAERGGESAGVEQALLEADGPFGDESGRIPSPTFAPLAVGLGAAILFLGLVLGPWLIGAGLILALLGAVNWLMAASSEYRAVDPEATQPAIRREGR